MNSMSEQVLVSSVSLTFSFLMRRETAHILQFLERTNTKQNYMLKKKVVNGFRCSVVKSLKDAHGDPWYHIQ